LLNDFQHDVRVGLISNTRQEIGELLKWVLLAFDPPYAEGVSARMWAVPHTTRSRKRASPAASASMRNTRLAKLPR
jgi:hypothetical protein